MACRPYRAAGHCRRAAGGHSRHNTLGPLHGWLTIWAGEVEIERRPDLYERCGGPKGQDALLPGGTFVHLIVPRHERVYIRQITAW
ncbi:hypothetical protein [Kitasatospora sp. GAS1066B]|uniref:hypothetical protein n=1 Tax=Kitasatospora sp. GAS1066B TaxID=3156271 RepID=UPI00351528D1